MGDRLELSIGAEPPTPVSSTPRVRDGAAVALALGYSWIVAGFHPLTWPMRVAVAIPIVLVLARSWRPAAGVDPAVPSGRAYRVGLAVWGGLFALLVAWEVFAYFGSPREDHPTLSSIAEAVMSTQLGRAAMFAAWLAAGLAVLGRSRAFRT